MPGYSAGGDDSAAGLYYSEDSGKTWQIATVQDSPLQVLQAPGRETGAVALAVVWNPIRRIFVAAVRNHGFYSSQDGVMWTRLQNQPGTALTLAACPPSSTGSPNCPIYSAALAVQAGSGDMFAMAVSQADADSGLWEDVCGAAGGSCSAPVPVFGKRIGNAALETSTGVIAGASHALWLQAIPSSPPNNNDTLYLPERGTCFAAAWRQDARGRKRDECEHVRNSDAGGAESAWGRVGREHGDTLLCERSRVVAHERCGEPATGALFR